MENKQIIGILAHNHPGVLLRITSLISRRGFNIDSLTASPSGIEGYSRLTVRISGDDDQVEQFINQMLKIVDIKKAEVLPDDSSVAMELILIKVNADQKNNFSDFNIPRFTCQPWQQIADIQGFRHTGSDRHPDNQPAPLRYP